MSLALARSLVKAKPASAFSLAKRIASSWKAWDSLQMAANGVELVVKIVDIERLQESASIAFSLTPARHRVLLKKAAGARLRRERPLIHVRA
jgi:hypothetical protein